MSKLVTRRVRRGRHVKRSRCGGKRSKRKGYTKKHYTRKNKKYIKNQKRLRRQTRKKVGGFNLFSSRPKNLPSRPKILPSLSDLPFNFVLPKTITETNNINIQGFGWAYVTRLNSITSMSDRPEQIIIYKKLDNAGQLTGNYFIARCPYTECDINDRENMREKHMKPLLQTQKFSFEVDKFGEYTFITTDRVHYRIKPGGSSLQKFFTSYIDSLPLQQPGVVDVSAAADAGAQQPGVVDVSAAADADDVAVAVAADAGAVAQQPKPNDVSPYKGIKYTEEAINLARYIEQRQEEQRLLEQQQELRKYAPPVQGNPSENVKIKSKSNMLGKERLTDANASIARTGKTKDRDYPEDIYTLYIDGKGKLKFLLKRDSGFEYDDANDKTIDGTCYRLYKFTDMVDKSKSIEIYVPVSRTIGSIFHTLQPQLAGNEDIDIFDLCGYD